MTAIAESGRKGGGTVGGRGQEARLRISGSGEARVVTVSGALTARNLTGLLKDLEALTAARPKAVTFDLSAMTLLDSAGAWILHRTRRDLTAAGTRVETRNARPEAAALIAKVAESDRPQEAPPPRPSFLVGLVERVGRGSLEAGLSSRNLTAFMGHTLVVFMAAILRPKRIRFTALVSQMQQSGLNALPIVGLISFLVGLVLAYQGADQLARFGAQVFTVNLVAVGVLREMGILLTAIIVAGRSGSAYTAQIGTMKVNEEIDALRTIGLDPMEILVLPRILGLVLVMPLLTFYADLMGILGGAVMVITTLDMSMVQFTRQLADAAKITDFWVGMIKAPLFAYIIAMVGCYEGLNVSLSAESVGRQTTRAVVEGIFLVIVLDAVLSIFFSVIGF